MMPTAIRHRLFGSLRNDRKRPANFFFQHANANMGSLNLGMTFPSYQRSLPKPRFSAPRIQKSNSYDIDFSNLRIPQGDAIMWDPIVLRYDDTVEPTSFTIDYWLTIGNGFGITQGAFHVVFKERPPSAATSA